MTDKMPVDKVIDALAAPENYPALKEAKSVEDIIFWLNDHFDVDPADVFDTDYLRERVRDWG